MFVMEGSGELSGSGLGITPVTTADHQGPDLPGYLAYLLLGFKFIATLITVLMSGWILFTIKSTRSLHKPHNIFVAHLMVADIISAVLSTAQTSIMMIGFATGVGDFINCRVFKFLLLTVMVIFSTYLMISVDQIIAIAFPFKHRRLMKCRVIGGFIASVWVLSALLSIHVFFNDGYTKTPQYGTCLSEGSTFVNTLITFILPIFIASFVAIILNAYLSVKAYQVRKQIQMETRLSGRSKELKDLKKKQATIKEHLKPMITLLVVVFSSTVFGLLFPLLYVPARLLETATTYEDVMKYVIGPNIGYMVTLLHPFVYGLYYKQVRDPMMKILKRLLCRDKFASAVVAPKP
ncbi:olfactory receptor 7C2-like [Dysidea avara]|uniref:olfactory receptor 7C2-like n=1 Tax=Dysidea avara TaxID=196820 RepID=UPI003330F81E